MASERSILQGLVLALEFYKFSKQELANLAEIQSKRDITLDDIKALREKREKARQKAIEV